MARTKQTARRPATREFVVETFLDHNGRPAKRFRLRRIAPSRITRAASLGYVTQPVYCFQIYLSVDLGIQDVRDLVELEYTTIDARREPLSCGHILTLVLHLLDIFDIQAPQPCWDIYTLPGQTTLDFVEHSRQEIIHRYARRQAGDVNVPYVSRAQYSDDQPRSAFLIVIDNDRAWRRRYGVPNEYVQAEQPIWVRFDARLPSSVTTIDESWRRRERLEDLTDDEQWMQFWNEQLEMEVKRVYYDGYNGCLRDIYHHCILDAHYDEYSGFVHGINANSPPRDLEDLDFITSTCQAVQLADTSSLLPSNDGNASFTMTRHNDKHCTFSSRLIDGEPDIKYVVYVPFVVLSSTALEVVASTFAQSFLQELGSEQTLHLDFYTPPSSSDAAILAHYHDLQLPPGSIGARTRLRDIFPNGINAERLPIEGPSRRLHPISRDLGIMSNDPNTTTQTPYSTFIVIIDRPDFVGPAAKPAIRFLLTHENQAGTLPSRPGTIAVDSPFMISWRAVNMAGVVDRMSFRKALLHAPPPYFDESKQWDSEKFQWM